MHVPGPRRQRQRDAADPAARARPSRDSSSGLIGSTRWRWPRRSARTATRTSAAGSSAALPVVPRLAPSSTTSARRRSTTSTLDRARRRATTDRDRRASRRRVREWSREPSARSRPGLGGDDLAPRGTSRPPAARYRDARSFARPRRRAREPRPRAVRGVDAGRRRRRAPGTRRAGFELVDGYLHVYIELSDGLRDLFPITADGIRPVRAFAHYVGDDRDTIRERFARVHEDVLYERRFS